MAFIFSDPFTVANVFILLIEMVIGISCTIFVIAVIVNESKRKKSMNAGNKIRVTLYISNVCYSITVFAGVSSGFLVPKNDQITNSTSAYVVCSLNMFTMSSSSWLPAVLSIFYFLKIVDFKARVIVWAKRNINAVVPWMIVGVEVSALISSFLGVLLLKNPHSSSINNSTSGINNAVSNYASGFLSIALIVSSAPFLIIVVTCGCIARTLIMHHRSMMESNVNSTNDKAKSYTKLVSKIKRLVLNYKQNA
ncbi:PREDICTED: taste receptor type 2 member 8-like [Nanorana parkeri]|uniref:taste receptor type 2 member 8-like n=1 Tax=Nanorana parkeri TaxID=125878 RepID=UPI000854A950|nr:PREDICTED: taste receptor type 2 member 8-like [Nanorana parkeri]